MTTESRNELSRSDWGPPMAIFVGLGIVVIANAIMISLALSRPSIPATTDHWAESLAWEQELERRAQSQALGWSIELGREHQALVIAIVDGQARPIAGLSGSATLRRADRSSDDRALALTEIQPGRYRSDPIAATGLYELSVTLRDAAGEAFVEHRWIELEGAD